MTPHYADESVTVYHGDCLAVLARLDDNSVDAVVTDPPYGLEFMGKEWDGADGFRRSLNPADIGRDDPFGRASRTSPEYRAGHTFQAWCEQWARECLRVLKPGGHMLAFGGTRTWHRLACAVEDAGFEIRDSIAWLYGSGFPKSLDVSKAIDKAAGTEREVVSSYPRKGRSAGILGAEVDIVRDVTAPATADTRTWQGWGTALKPAHEPIVVARKPLSGTVAANVLAHGTGALNIDGCRVAHASEADLAESQNKNRHADFGSGARENDVYGTDARSRASQGNYNGAKGRWPANVILDATQAATLDEQSGNRPGFSGGGTRGAGFRAQYVGGERPDTDLPASTYGDLGGASRFFYVAKADTNQRPRTDAVAHPTVKPLDLMRWLVRLVTPPGGIVLDPFAGSGTTAEACIIEGFRCITIEREPDYLPLIVQRLSKPIEPVMF